MPEVWIRPMRPEDIEEVFRIQCEAHPANYHEPPGALASRLAAAPGYCFVAGCGQTLLAYLLAHPWAGGPPELHAGLPACARPEHIFLHDVAVHPAGQGQALGVRLLSTLETACLATGWKLLRLTAVGGARGFWLRQGFVDRTLAKMPACYGEASWMEKPLSATATGAAA